MHQEGTWPGGGMIWNALRLMLSRFTILLDSPSAGNFYFCGGYVGCVL
jgi:hypothetical protein